MIQESGLATAQKMVPPGDSELSLLYTNSGSITTRYLKTDETVRRLSKIQFGDQGRVKLVVVTKGQPLEACIEVIAAGAANLGENYPEETVEKFTGVDKNNFNLHMIGHIQSRKIKFLHPLFNYIHSIDSKELAVKVSNYFAQQESKVNALIEVDFTSETSKSGFHVNNPENQVKFIEMFEELLALEGLNIIGLMTMGYYPENEETNRNIFWLCNSLAKTLCDRYKTKSIVELSMGTSGDYKTAIAEGATMVRIGELIMGPRINKEVI